jgi:hypothetical protein
MHDRLCAALLAGATLAGPAFGAERAPCGGDYDVAARETLRFPRGASSATVKSGVMSRYRDLYDVTAKKGQTLTVRIGSAGDNAVFQICRPDGKQTLEGAGFGEDATRWSGTLVTGGRYTIIVGPSRQSAQYDLTVTIE